MDELKSDMVISAAQRSTRGLKPRNEDSIGILIPEQALRTTKGVASVISDGFTDVAFSKEASETCVQSFLTDYYATPETWTVKSSAHKVLISLNRWLCGQGQSVPVTQKGYLCTLSVIIFKSQVGYIFHVGDTRIYRIRGEYIEQLTNDHTSLLSSSKACLTRAMGLGFSLEIDFKTVNLEEGDIYLLTTDGIHGFLKDSMLRDTVLAHLAEGKQSVCDRLIEAALEHGSDDNLSCQILQIDQLGHSTKNDMINKLGELPVPPVGSKGMILDGYRIERELHASTRSYLYLVTDVDTGEPYVLKAASPNFEDDPVYIKRFVMEAWVGSRIESDYVVSIVAPPRSKRFLYHVMEYVDGVSLADWLKQNTKPDISEVVNIISGVVRGVRAFHRKETLHQGIKLENIILDRYNKPVIIDFGSTYIAGIEEMNTALERDTVLGTEGYVAPEYILGRSPNTHADLYSIGVLCYELLTGYQPYGEQYSRCGSAQALSALQYTPSFHYNPMVPVWLDGAIQKAVQISPSLRYQTLSEFVYDLKNPNPKFLKGEAWAPWVERNPLQFWKSLSAILAAANLLLIYMLSLS